MKQKSAVSMASFWTYSQSGTDKITWLVLQTDTACCFINREMSGGNIICKVIIWEVRLPRTEDFNPKAPFHTMLKDYDICRLYRSIQSKSGTFKLDWFRARLNIYAQISSTKNSLILRHLKMIESKWGFVGAVFIGPLDLQGMLHITSIQLAETQILFSQYY